MANIWSCKEFRRMIKEDKLPKLPISKKMSGEQKQMHLAWHVKVVCNKNFSHMADHFPYEATKPEYVKLSHWCSECWKPGFRAVRD